MRIDDDLYLEQHHSRIHTSNSVTLMFKDRQIVRLMGEGGGDYIIDILAGGALPLHVTPCGCAVNCWLKTTPIPVQEFERILGNF